MAAFDTNVVVRLLVQDDEEQCRRAEAALRRAAAADGAWISAVVLAEVSWVLRGAYRFDRAATAGALRRLVTADGIIVHDAAAVSRALSLFEVGSADFADYMILESARGADALPVLTFDERLAREDGAERVP